MKAKLGPDHPDTLKCMHGLASPSAPTARSRQPLYEETLKLQKAKLGPDHPIPSDHDNLATPTWPQQARPRAAALPGNLALKKVRLGPDHAETLATMGNLGWGYQYAGKLDRALPLLEECLAPRRRSSAPITPVPSQP